MCKCFKNTFKIDVKLTGTGANVIIFKIENYAAE